jgi:hypothetical protein
MAPKKLTNEEYDALKEAMERSCCDCGVFGTDHDVKDFTECLADLGYTFTLKKVK